ncbi:transcriptional regulator NanR [Vibrio vulnificus]|nr:transcriptional regulator NanR [Vibrio vulnificus]ELE2041496.1 transcriptional regulator NanR [Vibrio vulnificus]HAS8263251.1 transcriptional regulator NanR [Vibrio vulnificus]
MNTIVNRRPITKRKLSDIVEEELELMIRQGEFSEGEQLPSERDLMGMFDVGRPSIREALSALSRKGLVKIASGERARVCRPSADTIISELSGMAKDFLLQPGGIKNFEQLRQFFESSLVRYAAQNATEEQLEALEKALEKNQRSLSNPELFSKTDVVFHRVLASIPGNPIFMAVYQAMVDWLITARPPVKDPIALAKMSYGHHKAIVDAIKSHDPDKAEEALKCHLDNVYDTYYK